MVACAFSSVFFPFFDFDAAFSLALRLVPALPEEPCCSKHELILGKSISRQCYLNMVELQVWQEHRDMCASQNSLQSP